MKRAEVNAIQCANQADLLNDLRDREEILDLASEQAKDEAIMQAIEWKRNGLSSNMKYASRRLKNYAKQFDRLEIENNTLYRQFFDDTSRIIFKQYCLSKHLWKEVIYTTHQQEDIWEYFAQFKNSENDFTILVLLNTSSISSKTASHAYSSSNQQTSNCNHHYSLYLHYSHSPEK